MKWPEKDARELFEVNQFIAHYGQLPQGRAFEIVGNHDKKFSGPDYFLRDLRSNEVYGVELTSVYNNNRSVPDVHMRPFEREEAIPYEADAIKKYLEKVLDDISEKVRKAKSNYDLSSPLILSIYLNEYLSVWIDEKSVEFIHKRE